MAFNRTITSEMRNTPFERTLHELGASAPQSVENVAEHSLSQA